MEPYTNTSTENSFTSLKAIPRYEWLKITLQDLKWGKYGIEGCIYWNTERNPEEYKVCGQDIRRRIDKLFEIKRD